MWQEVRRDDGMEVQLKSGVEGCIMFVLRQLRLYGFSFFFCFSLPWFFLTSNGLRVGGYIFEGQFCWFGPFASLTSSPSVLG